MLRYSSVFLHRSVLLTCDYMLCCCKEVAPESGTEAGHRSRTVKAAIPNGIGNKGETGGYGEYGNMLFTFSFCIKNTHFFMIGCAAGGWRLSSTDGAASTGM